MVRDVRRQYPLHVRMGRVAGLGVGLLEPPRPEKEETVFQKTGERLQSRSGVIFLRVAQESFPTMASTITRMFYSSVRKRYN